MLQGLRKLASGLGAKIFFGLLVFSFAVWGIADVFNVRSPETVLTAGEASVSLQDYALAYERTRAPVEQQIGRRLTAEEAATFGLDQAVLGQLADEAVLDAQALAVGVALSDGQLAREIASDPSFHDGTGAFSRDRFRQLLSQNGIPERAYIESQGEAARRRQIVEAVTRGVALPAVMREALGTYVDERRTVEYVTLPAALVEPVAAPSPEALQTYFDSNKQRYAAPEYRAVDYAVLTPQSLADPEAVTPEAIQADYDGNLQRYRTPERRRVAQIVFPDKAAADAAKAKLDSGTPFATVATEAGRTSADTDLGLIQRSDIPDPAVAEAAFALPLGGVSPVVPGAFGSAIVTVSEIQAEAVRPLAEVSDEIRRDLALDAANDQSASAYKAFEDARAGGATLAEAASSAGLTLQSIRQMDAEGNAPDGKPVPDFPGKARLVTEVFDTDQGVDNPPIGIDDNGYVFYEVTNVEPARDRALDEVRERVVADWTAAERDRLLDERAGALKAEAEGGKPLADIAAEVGNGVTVQTAQAISRQSGTAEIGQAATRAAFSGAEGTVATAPAAGADARVLLRVLEVAEPADPAAAATAERVSQIETAIRNDLYSGYVAELQGLYPVRVHPQAIEQAKAMVR